MVDKDFDSEYILRYENVVGIDEVGRGSLAGPVVAAAVKLEGWIDGLDDSKKISASKREKILERIILNAQLSIGIATPTEIDLYNIVGATKIAMKRAYENLNIQAFALIDGLEMGFDFPHESIVRGDGKSPSIAAASIVAKVYRDEVMKKVSPFFEDYGFSHNMGYATKQHLHAIKEKGPTLFHRLTFEPVKKALTPSLIDKWKEMGKNPLHRLRGRNLHLFFN